MSDFDNNLKKALNGEVQPDPGRLDGARQQAATAFKKRLRLAGYLSAIFMVFCVAVFLAGIYQFERAMDVKEMIIIAVLLIILAEGMVLMKLWYWGFRQHIDTMREIKRLQFRVEDLAMGATAESSREPLSDLGDLEQSLPLGRGGKPYAVFVTVLLLVLGYVIVFQPVIKSRGLSSGFVGSQVEEWHVVSPELIETHSELTVTNWPGDPVVMKIQLPYPESELKSVTCAGEDLTFHHLHGGRYELELPPDWKDLEEKVFEVICAVPIDSPDTRFVKGRKAYGANLKTLIPSHRYSLTVFLEENCGFEFVHDPDEQEMRPFSGTHGYPFTMDYGECATVFAAKE